MTEPHDPANGAAQQPVAALCEDAQGRAQALIERITAASCRTIDRDLHAILKPDADPKLPIPRYSTSADAILRAIAQVLPRWVHGHAFFPQPAEDQAVEVRAWVAGPGYITDEHANDCFEAEAATVPAALTAALLKCLAANGRRA